MQGRNGDRDIENGLVDTGREGKSGMNRERSIDTYTRSCAKQIAGELAIQKPLFPVLKSV